MRGEDFVRRRLGRHVPIPSSNPGFQLGPSRLLDRPPLQVKSEVAVVRAISYAQAEAAVREAIALLGGIGRVCKPGDNVLIKPNVAMATPPELCETTHPAIVAAMVKVLKEAGATVRIGEKAGWEIPTDIAYERSGIKQAALDAGADEVLSWERGERVEVEIPGARALKTAKIHRSVVDADVYIELPKLKNNFMMGSGGLTLGIKSKLGLLTQDERHVVHKDELDMAWACCDVAKIVKDKHRLTLIDGIGAVEGGTHYGHICHPGVIVASPDVVAADAVAHVIAGYHPLENPAVQVAMKDGLGTGDLAEINVLGTRLQDVIYPFQRSLPRFVQKYMNVTEYVGGTCLGCRWAAVSVPPIVDPDKKYAVVSGKNVLIANPLEVDEVWLVGECACRADHQRKGFMDKVQAAKKVVKVGTCPGIHALVTRTWQGVYDTPMLLGSDMIAFGSLPDTIRAEVLAAAEARREGREKARERKS